MYRQPTGQPIPKTGTACKMPKTPAKVTAEQARKKAALKQIKAAKLVITKMHCEGCGEHTAYLDLSHLASQKQYPHLAEVPENCRLHCRECHDKWHGDIPGREQMKDYNQNRAILEKICPEALNKLDLKTAA